MVDVYDLDDVVDPEDLGDVDDVMHISGGKAGSSLGLPLVEVLSFLRSRGVLIE